MIPEIDIWRAAHLMIRQYGEDAAHQTDARAGVLIEQGETLRAAQYGGTSARLSTSYRTTGPPEILPLR